MARPINMRFINETLRHAAQREAKAAEAAALQAQREADFHASMGAVIAAAAHYGERPAERHIARPYHPSQEGERPHASNWPRPDQRVIPGKKPVPSRAAPLRTFR